MVIFSEAQLFMHPFDKQKNMPHHLRWKFYQRSAIEVNRKIRQKTILQNITLFSRKSKQKLLQNTIQHTQSEIPYSYKDLTAQGHICHIMRWLKTAQIDKGIIFYSCTPIILYISILFPFPELIAFFLAFHLVLFPMEAILQFFFFHFIQYFLELLLNHKIEIT